MKNWRADQIQSIFAIFHVRIFSDILHTDSHECENVMLCSRPQIVSAKWLHDIQFQKRVSFVILALALYWYETCSCGKLWLMSLGIVAMNGPTDEWIQSTGVMVINRGRSKYLERTCPYAPLSTADLTEVLHLVQTWASAVYSFRCPIQYWNF
jgi:hypothetical protein